MKNKRLVAMCVVAATVIVAVMAISAICGPRVSGYEMHSVQSGDTLWGIAKEYNPGYECVEEIVHEMRKVNGMESSVIYVGEVIEVPILE